MNEALNLFQLTTAKHIKTTNKKLYLCNLLLLKGMVYAKKCTFYNLQQKFTIQNYNR